MFDTHIDVANVIKIIAILLPFAVGASFVISLFRAALSF